MHTGGEKKLGWVTGALKGEKAGVKIKEQMSAWSLANHGGFAVQRESPTCVNYRERKSDPLTAVIEENLKPG
jgi:hypothetical protein